jgi:hypothetical protein
MENLEELIRKAVEQNESLSLDDKKDREVLIAHLIVEMKESISDSNTSAFGDGWYDGFLEAQKLAEDDDSGLSELKEDEVREMSEHAESEHAELKDKAA